ncbi:kelch-like protein 2 isoform X2 [Acyrthosiphon pisum]|uniref:Kelch-like protein diablo n=1 Tax=Acyrthosiphon pisum TaxID=7029 RepID=A0A8R2NUN4_ACYPI|nr:kelch-like protein 2 isoform X2 [Acyrthosiphon pisum]
MSDQEPMWTNFCNEKRFSLSYDALNTMRRNNQFCDVVFVVGEKKIAAHKVILASHSNYFNKMFTGHFKDTEFLEVTNEEITPNSLELLLDFLYTSQLKINDSNVQDLLMGSIFLLLNDVKKECLKYIEQKTDIENFMTLKSIADKNKIRELHELFLSYTLKNYKNIVKSNKFLSFSFELMMELIQSDDLCAEEEEVYESTKMWLKYDLKERLKYLPVLINSIRLSLIPVDYLDSTVQEEDLIQSDIACMRCLFHAYKVHRQTKTMDNESVLNYNITHRKFTQKSQLFNIFGNQCSKDDHISPLNNFLLIKDSPEFMSLTFEQIMELIKSDDLCAEELQVYEAIITWVKYDVKNRSELFPKLFLSIRLPLIQVKDLINIVENEELVSSNSICMDFLLNTYRTLLALERNVPMKTSNSSELNIFNYRNRNLKQAIVLYRRSDYSKIEWYDKMNNTFYECSLTWYSDATTSNLILKDGRIFSISCKDGVNSVKLYDGNLNTWKSISTPHFVHNNSSIIQFYDQVYVMSSSGSEYYNILSETWQEVKFKITETQNLKLAVVSDLIYGVCETKAFYYNPKTDFGQLISSPSDMLTVYSIFSFNNQLYLIGCEYKYQQYSNQRILHLIYDKFNPQTNSWSRIKEEISNRKAPGVVVLDEKLYLMGGTNNKSIQFYEPKSDSFKTKSELYYIMHSSEHHDTQAFVVDTEIIQ